MVSFADGLEFCGGLEVVEAGGAHGQVCLGRGLVVRVALNVDIFARVDHQDTGIAARAVRVVGQEDLAVVPVLDPPGACPLGALEVVAGRGRVGRAVWVRFHCWDVDILTELAKVKELVVAKVVGRCGVGSVTVTVRVCRQWKGSKDGWQHQEGPYEYPSGSTAWWLETD